MASKSWFRRREQKAKQAIKHREKSGAKYRSSELTPAARLMLEGVHSSQLILECLEKGCFPGAISQKVTFAVDRQRLLVKHFSEVLDRQVKEDEANGLCEPGVEYVDENPTSTEAPESSVGNA